QETEEIKGIRWLPEPAGRSERAWRVPNENSLSSLMMIHDRLLKGGRLLGVSYAFDLQCYVKEGQKQRPVHAFALVDEDGAYRSFDPRYAIKVAAWLRHAAHERAKAMKLDADFIERFVCGHGENAEAKNDRFSYLPLPTIAPKG